MATTEFLPFHQGESLAFHESRSSRSSPPSSSSSSTTTTTLLVSDSPLSHPPDRKFSPTPTAEHHESILNPHTPPSLTYSPRSSLYDLSDLPSSASTSTSSGLSFDTAITADDDIDFPNYDGMHFPQTDDEYGTHRKLCEDENEPPEISTTTDTTQSDSPLPTPTVADDTAIREEPSRHVDYLSHDWREEDIWASWRHIVSQRKVYGQRSRLENASWRTWAKSKYHLRTVSPETLNWLKESDVTWLYGPLKNATTHPLTSVTSAPSSQLSKSGSFINKKPILKKRSVSEVMLQKSLSTSSLIKQAAAAVQAQQITPPIKRSLGRTRSDFMFQHTPATAPSEPPSREDYFSERFSSSANETPSDGREERHIRFDEKVEQCIAVECKDGGLDDDDDGASEMENEPSNSVLSESSSDEGLVMMKKRQRPRPRLLGSNRVSRNNSFSGSKMIETIPSTTLKSRTDSPDVSEDAQHHVFGKNWNSGKLSPSPSQETLRPSRPSRNFLLTDEDDEEEEETTSTSWSFGAGNPKSSLGASAGAGPSNVAERDFAPSESYEGVQGMRRTESGMFMPYDEDEDDLVAAGLFGRVSETFNTVKDIGYVLWNVGFRNGTP